MKIPFNLEYAPASYFADVNLETRLGSKINGEVRKQQVLESAKSKYPPPYLMKSKISDQQRFENSKLHPRHMGGEYLQELELNQVEICRVIIHSTMLDVTSIRATLVGNEYFFDVTDEYEMFRYNLPIKSQTAPLTTSQMITQIDNCSIVEVDATPECSAQYTGLMDPVLSLHLNAGRDPSELIDYISVDSAFYPELTGYYQNKINKFLASLS